MLKDCLAQTILFAHMGGDGIFRSSNVNTIRAILKNNESANHQIYFDLSLSVFNYVFEDEIDDNMKYTIFKEIGVHRILFGSDYPISNSSKYLKLLKERIPMNEEEWKIVLNNDYL